MKSQRLLPALLITCLCSVFFFSAKLLLDNKYRLPGPQAQDGFLILEDGGTDILFLRDGWEFYQYQSLTPDQLATGRYRPTGIVTLGRSSMLNLGRSNASLFGSGTYRLVILTGRSLREYMIELPEIYTRYDLYINGELKRSVGTPGQIDTLQSQLTFKAAEVIDLVFVVESAPFWNSGMVYPPAFGTPLAVSRLLGVRLMLAVSVCSAALLTALLHLAVGFLMGKRRIAVAYALLCFSLILCIGRIPIHTLGLGGVLWYRLEAMGSYGLFLSLLFIQARICPVPKSIRRMAGIVGLTACIWSAMGPDLAAAGLPALLFYSCSLDAYRWVAALYLIISTTWYAKKRVHGSLPLACGFYLFGIALLADRALPRYEPILFFWPIETAGFFLVLLLSVLLGADAVRAFRASAQAKAEAELYAKLEQAQRLRYEQMVVHNDGVRRLRHDLRAQLLAYQDLLLKRRYQELADELAQVVGAATPPDRYSANSVVDRTLNAFLSQLGGTDVEATVDLSPLPPELPFQSTDLCSILLNLLENAKDACLNVPAPSARRISLSIHLADGQLLISCKNPYCGVLHLENGRFRTGKADTQNHGIGLRQINSIVQKYCGIWNIQHSDAEFQVDIVLPVITY